jgi:hypothetical protein
METRKKQLLYFMLVMVGMSALMFYVSYFNNVG